MRSYFLPDQPFSTVVSNVIPSFRIGWLPFLEDPDQYDQIESENQSKSHCHIADLDCTIPMESNHHSPHLRSAPLYQNSLPGLKIK
jgi:hypothetical protein